MESLSRHIVSLDINSLGADTYTNIHTDVHTKTILRKPGMRGLRWFNKQDISENCEFEKESRSTIEIRKQL